MLKSNRAWKAPITVLAFALALPLLAAAEPEPEPAAEARGFGRGPGGARHSGGRGPDPGYFIDRHGAELGLDVETRESIQAIVDESRSRSEGLRSQMRGEHEALRGLLSHSAPDDAAVMSQSDRIEALKSEQRKIRLEAMLAIRKLLTPEQREQLVAIREERRAGRAEGRRFRDEAGPRGSDRVEKGRRRPLAGCREDVATLCSEAEPGRPRLQCLDAEWDNLSDGCRAAFEGRGRRGPRRNQDLDPNVD